MQLDWSNITNTPIPASQFNNGVGYILAHTSVGTGRWDFGGGSVGYKTNTYASMEFVDGGLIKAWGATLVLTGNPNVRIDGNLLVQDGNIEVPLGAVRAWKFEVKNGDT